MLALVTAFGVEVVTACGEGSTQSHYGISCADVPCFDAGDEGDARDADSGEDPLIQWDAAADAGDEVDAFEDAATGDAPEVGDAADADAGDGADALED